MAEKPQQVRDRAHAQFKKAAQPVEGRGAGAEYRAETLAVREKTARLRSLRLAKEAADSETAAAEATHRDKAATRKRR